MTEQERQRIRSSASDFFATHPAIWENSIKRFPFVFEKSSSDNAAPMGGEDSVGLLLCLLSSGEVRTPIQWQMDDQRGGGASSSSSEVIQLFFRTINGQFEPTNLGQVSHAFSVAGPKLTRFLYASSSDVLGTVLVDRLLSIKAHPLTQGAKPAPQAIARVTDVAMLLEYLFHEGNTTETAFRLSMSMAWLLGRSPDERLQIIKTVRAAYGLRSKRVHGASLDERKDLNDEMVAVIKDADRLLRRAIVVWLLCNLKDDAWRKLFSSARVGSLPENFDQASWIP